MCSPNSIKPSHNHQVCSRVQQSECHHIYVAWVSTTTIELLQIRRHHSEFPPGPNFSSKTLQRYTLWNTTQQAPAHPSHLGHILFKDTWLAYLNLEWKAPAPPIIPSVIKSEHITSPKMTITTLLLGIHTQMRAWDCALNLISHECCMKWSFIKNLIKMRCAV